MSRQRGKSQRFMRRLKAWKLKTTSVLLTDSRVKEDVLGNCVISKYIHWMNNKK